MAITADVTIIVAASILLLFRGVVVTQAEMERAKGAAPISEFSWLLDNQTLVDELSSPRQQFDEHAIARRHSAVRKSEAGNVRRRQAVGELRRCDFDCVHGRCNPITRNCVCLEGWRGAACDICAEGRLCDWSALRPRLTLLLPQTGAAVDDPAQSTPIYAYGSGFPRGKNSRYNCLFGDVATQGRWLSNAVVECRRPPRAHIGKHVFNLVPFASNAFVPYDAGMTPHFTFYTRCEPSACQGSCVGPLCLCPTGRSGLHCEIAHIQGYPSASKVIQFDASATESTRAIEFRPFVAKLPVESDSVRLRVIQTDIRQLVVDPFEHTVSWHRPVGRASRRPYSTLIEMTDCDSRSVLNWTLSVPMSYRPIFVDVDSSASLSDSVGNTRTVSGRLVGISTGNSPDELLLANATVAVRLRRKRSNGEVVESFDARVETNAIADFRLQVYPYPAAELTESSKLSVAHSGMEEDAGDDKQSSVELRFVAQSLRVKPSSASIPLNCTANFTQLYAVEAASSSGSVDDECFSNEQARTGKWHAVVLEPRERISVSAVRYASRQLAVVFTMVPHFADQPFPPDTRLRTVFSCDAYYAPVVVEQRLEPVRPADAVVRLSPERIFVVANRGDGGIAFVPPPPSVVKVDIELEYISASLRDTALRSLWNTSSADFAPFRLVWGRVERLGREERAAGRIRLWLALSQHAALSAPSSEAADVDDVIRLPNSFNPLISIPYRIRRITHPGHGPRLTFTLTIRCLSDEDIGSVDALPAAVVDVELISASRAQQHAVNVQLNVPTRFTSISPDYFQLNVKSVDFLPLVMVIKITADNDSLTVALERRPSWELVVDASTATLQPPDDISFTETMDRGGGPGGPATPDVPTLSIEPSVVRFSETDESPIRQMFADFVYRSGPRDSFASLDVQGGLEWNGGGFEGGRENATFTIQIVKDVSGAPPPICIGCGYRLSIRIGRNPKRLDRGNCNVFYVDVPFTYTVSGVPTLLRSSTYLFIDTRPSRVGFSAADSSDAAPIICASSAHDASARHVVHEELETPTRRTRVERNCAAAALRRCRAAYQPATLCDRFLRGSGGSNAPIADNVLSIEIYAQFLLLAANCRQVGVDLRQLQGVIRCIAKVNVDCPSSIALANQKSDDRAKESRRSGKLLIDPSFLIEGGRLFNQLVPVQPALRAGVDRFFPALSAVEMQLINFPTLLLDFLHQLDVVFPPDEMAGIFGDPDTSGGKRSAEWLDRFVKVIADESDGGAEINDDELNNLKDWQRGGQLINRWNRMFRRLRGGLFDADSTADVEDERLVLNGRVPQALADFRELTRRADRVKTVTRQFGGDSAFNVLHDVLRKLFANVDAPSSESAASMQSDVVDGEPLVADAWVRVTPTRVTEGEEMHVVVAIRNRLVGAELRNVRIQLAFGEQLFPPPFAFDSSERLRPPAALKYRLGPVFYSGIATSSADSRIPPNGTMIARWIAVPVPEFRLTDTITQTPQVIVSVEHSVSSSTGRGSTTIRRLQAPSFCIEPRKSLRILAFAYPTLNVLNGGGNTTASTTTDERGDFTAQLAIINSGYSTLNTVEIVEFSATLASADTPSQLVDYRISGIRLDGAELDATAEWMVDGGGIASGRHRHLTFNVSTIGDVPAFFHNLSVFALVDGALPAQFDYRFFLIHDTVVWSAIGGGESSGAERRPTLAAAGRFIVSESHLPYPLYFYEAAAGRLSTLSTLQVVQEKFTHQIANGHEFRSVFVVFRRLSTTAELHRSGGTAARTPVFGTFFVDVTRYFVNDAESGARFQLLRVTQLRPSAATQRQGIDSGGGVQQRQVESINVWVDAVNATIKAIKFVDLDAKVFGASNGAGSNQLLYEFLFGDPRHYRLPYFPQPAYRVHLAPEVAYAWRDHNQLRYRIRTNTTGGNGRRASADSLVIGRIRAASPLGQRMNYTLLSPDERSRFQVIPSTGEIVLVGNASPSRGNVVDSNRTAAELPVSDFVPMNQSVCANLLTSDEEGRRVVVPLTIVAGTPPDAEKKCSRFPESLRLFRHEYRPDDESRLINTAELLEQQMEQQQQKQQLEGSDKKEGNDVVSGGQELGDPVTVLPPPPSTDDDADDDDSERTTAISYVDSMPMPSSTLSSEELTNKLLTVLPEPLTTRPPSVTSTAAESTTSGTTAPRAPIATVATNADSMLEAAVGGRTPSRPVMEQGAHVTVLPGVEDVRPAPSLPPTFGAYAGNSGEEVHPIDATISSVVAVRPATMAVTTRTWLPRVETVTPMPTIPAFSRRTTTERPGQPGAQFGQPGAIVIVASESITVAPEPELIAPDRPLPPAPIRPFGTDVPILPSFPEEHTVTVNPLVSTTEWRTAQTGNEIGRGAGRAQYENDRFGPPSTSSFSRGGGGDATTTHHETIKIGSVKAATGSTGNASGTSVGGNATTTAGGGIRGAASSTRVSGWSPTASRTNTLLALSGGDEQTSAAMVDMACRQQTKKPIWAVICDLARTVYRMPSK